MAYVLRQSDVLSGPSGGQVLCRAWRLVVLMGLLQICIGPATSSHLQAASFQEYPVKAVFLLNLTNFVTWPEKAFEGPQAPFSIRVIGSNPFERALEQAVQGENVDGRQISVRNVLKVEDLDTENFQILFISASHETHWPEILQKTRHRNILTVSDVQGFAQQGGIINLVRRQNRIMIEVNPVAAKQAGLGVSAKLLNLARIVSGPAP